jgi:DNA replication and repair protein RecF
LRILDLRISNLRRLGAVEMELGPDWNLLLGGNGAGKTSVLEAVFLLSHGRSFRTGARDVLAGPAGNEYSVWARIHADGADTGVGIARSHARYQARIAGDPVTMGDLAARIAVVCFEPGSHALIAGGAEERRRFLDWSVFHVEHDFLGNWRRYQRALRQRNALLRSGGDADLLDSWDRELSEAATPLRDARRTTFACLAPLLVATLADLLPELGPPEVRLDDGWDADCDLEEVLASRRDRDLGRGFTSRGPHRADWMLAFAAAPRREHLSRGQEKLCAVASLLAQARLYASRRGEWPILCLDDLASELDAAHLEQVVSIVQASGAQVLVTGTSDAGLRGRDATLVFHVEQGKVARLL